MHEPPAFKGPQSFPSDLTQLTEGARVLLGGRVVRVTETELVLADALATCIVELAGNSEAPLGAWVQVYARLTTTGPTPRLTSGEVTAVHAGALSPRGQFARFTKVTRHLRSRAHATNAVRGFFGRRGFLEVSTPVRVPAPGTDVYLEPQPSGDQWLITSPEFHLKRLLVGGVPRLFEFAHCTRRDEVGAWHQPEFTMLEWYSLFQSFDELMRETEQLVLEVASSLEVAETITVKGTSIRLDQGFEAFTVADAFRRFAGVSDVVTLAAEDEDTYFQLMVDEVDPALARIPKPVLLTHYPLSQAALSAPSAAHPGFAERFELFIGGVELCNGYGELTCAATQRERFEADVQKRHAMGRPFIPVDDGLLAALEEGLPPCAGNALGFDRLVAVLLEQPLSDVVAFPAPNP
jgi:lysyl-tRNA synthetase class 2